MNKQITIGMSGHIDHGKTSIVELLTGQNTDVLIQEKERGMTIDVGFAHLSSDITIIDVPGHEKFIKNMVTGVSYIDFALLVVAADDGVMPQTKEHLEILKILNISNGAVVVNKIDLVEQDWLELVKLEIKDLVKDSFLEHKEMFDVSAKNNIGFDKLKAHLLTVKDKNKIQSGGDFFRMYVDRSFKQPGFGTVITGTVISGKVLVGQTLNVMPSNKQGRIRAAQSHNKDVKSVSFGERAAINLHNIEINDVKRGAHVSNEGVYFPETKFLARISVLEKKDLKIKQNQRLRFHIGPNEIIGRINIVESRNIESGESKICLINLERPVTIAFMDKFLIRSFSPILTLGGGQILDLNISGKWKEIKKYAINLDKRKNIKDRIIYIIENQKNYPFTISKIQKRLGKSIKEITEYIQDKHNYSIIKYLSFEWILTNNQILESKRNIISAIQEFHRQNPYSQGILKNVILQKNGGDENFLDYLISCLIDDLKLERVDEYIKIKDFKINLSKDENILMNRIMEVLNQQKFTSDNAHTLSLRLKQDEAKIKLLLRVAEQDDKIIRLDEDLLFTTHNFEILLNDLKIFFNKNKKMTVSDFKNIAQTTRKYAMPILEYLDKLKITVRTDNYRKLL